ncbi:MAG: amidohydrolase family protein [Dehalobacterium sp.]
MIIDGHAHACGEYLTADSILKKLDENSTDAVVLCPGELNKDKGYKLPDLYLKYPNKDFIYAINRLTKIIIALTGAAKQIDEGNEYVFSLVKQAPHRILQFYWANPNDKNVIDKIENNYALWNFKGIKLHQCWHKFSLRNENLGQIVKWAENKGLPVFIHLASQQDAMDMVWVVNRHKDACFIIAHMIGMEVFSQAELQNENVYFDMSGGQLIPQKKLLSAIEKFGAKKILMGSDTPYGMENFKKAITRVNNLPLSEDEKHMIMGGNLQNILRLNVL